MQPEPAEILVANCILAPLSGNNIDEVTLAAALAVARSVGAHMDALHVRPDPREVAASLVGGDIGGGWGLDDLMRSVEASAEERAQAAERRFAWFCTAQQLQVGRAPQSPGTSAVLTTATGSRIGLYAEHGRTSDMVVLGVERDESGIDWDVLEAVLVRTGRPVLIARDRPTQSGFDTVVIGWKDTREAARAVGAASAFIERAKRVVIFCVDEESAAATESASRLMRSLCWHNPSVTVERIYSTDDKRPPERLLEAAAALPAGLLVMGAYGHSRLREWVFGGFTEHVLRRSKIPVLMMH